MLQCGSVDKSTLGQTFGMFAEEFRQHAPYSAPFFGQADAHRPSVNIGTLMVHVPKLNQLFQIVADV
jgi:hypothetical protein